MFAQSIAVAQLSLWDGAPGDRDSVGTHRCRCQSQHVRIVSFAMIAAIAVWKTVRLTSNRIGSLVALLSMWMDTYLPSLGLRLH